MEDTKGVFKLWPRNRSVATVGGMRRLAGKARHSYVKSAEVTQQFTSRMLGAPRAEKKSIAWLGPRPRGAIVALGEQFGSSSPVCPAAFLKSAPLPVSVLPSPPPSPPSILKGKMEVMDPKYVRRRHSWATSVTPSGAPTLKLVH